MSTDGTGDYSKIQDAVDHAAAGAIVRIGKGTWNEAVTVTQPLTLEGSDWGVSRIVCASASPEQTSPELVQGLERISRELDAETQAKLRRAFLRVFSALPVVTVKGTEGVSIRNISLLRSEPVRKGGFTDTAAVDILDASVQIENCAILESPGVGLKLKGDSHVQVKIGDHDAGEKAGITQGLQVLGASQPTTRHNIFVTCEDAVYMGDIGAQGPFSKSSGEMTLIENVFWNNERNLARYDVEAHESRGLPLPKGNLEQQPDFTDTQNHDFRLGRESPLLKVGIGAQHFVSLDSPWPVQPEEGRSISAVAERLKETAPQR